MAPKLPRNWTRFSMNELSTRDDSFVVVGGIAPGQTIERVRFHYRIMGRTNTSDVLGLFDAYYIGIQVAAEFAPIPAQAAWINRSSQTWTWWEGAHFTPYRDIVTTGQTTLIYPRDDFERDIHAKRLWTGDTNGAVWFCFARSGGTVLTDQAVNVVGSCLLLG